MLPNVENCIEGYKVQDSQTSELRGQLRNKLFALTLEFGPTFPVKREEVEKSTILDASDFSSYYPDLRVLCHYTDASGLEGILKSGTFWATNVAFLNDPEELRFAYRAFEGMIRKGTHALDETLVGAFLDGLRTGGHDDESDRTYIICFSARSDDLSQFRAYSDNARGYALEFEPCELIQALNSYLKHGSGEFMTLRKVRYGEEDLAQFHVRAINELKNCISQLPHPAGSNALLGAVRAFGMDFHDYLREAGVVFKQAGYKNEEEYRAVLDVAGLMSGVPLDLEQKLAVRFRGALPVPFIPFQFLPVPTKRGYFVERDNAGGLLRIVVGPGIEPDLAETGLFYLLRQNGLHKGIDIQRSQSSYRTW